MASNKTKVYNSVWFRRLVACIGLHATRKLISKYPGQTIKVPKVNVFLLATRNIEITKDWMSQRYNKKDLELKWGLSYPTILKIIKETQNDPQLKNWLE